MAKIPKMRGLIRRRRRRDGGRLGALLGWIAIVSVLTLATVALMGRLLSAPPALVAAAVAFLPYLFIAVAVGLFVLWALLPDRRTLPASLCTVILLGAALWGPSWSARGGAAEGVPVRVMSWNLRRLWGGPDDGGDPLKCAVAAIEASDPDVLSLLEVSAEDIGRLEAALGMQCAHHPYMSISGSKHGGLAACTRGAWHLQSGRGQRFVDARDWYYVFAEVEHDARVFNLFAVHLSPYEYVAKRLRTGVKGLAKGDAEPLQELGEQGSRIVAGQSDQAAALLHRVERLSDPTVIAGDFNSTRDASLHASLRHHLTDAWEHGGQGFGGTVHLFGWLPLRIDYVYASEELPVVQARLPTAGCSDHLPVVVDLVLED